MGSSGTATRPIAATTATVFVQRNPPFDVSAERTWFELLADRGASLTQRWQRIFLLWRWGLGGQQRLACAPTLSRLNRSAAGSSYPLALRPRARFWYEFEDETNISHLPLLLCRLSHGTRAQCFKIFVAESMLSSANTLLPGACDLQGVERSPGSYNCRGVDQMETLSQR